MTSDDETSEVDLDEAQPHLVEYSMEDYIKGLKTKKSRLWHYDLAITKSGHGSVRSERTSRPRTHIKIRSSTKHVEHNGIQIGNTGQSQPAAIFETHTTAGGLLAARTVTLKHSEIGFCFAGGHKL